MYKQKLKTLEIGIIYNGLIFTAYFGGPGRFGETFISSLDAMYRLLVCVMILIQLLLYYRRSDLRMNINKRYIFLFLGVVICSSIANSNDYLVSFEECVKLILTTAYAIFIVNIFSIKNILKIAIVAQIFITFLNCFMLLFQSSKAYDLYYGAFIGIYTSKNNMAYSLAVGILLSVLFLYNYRKIEKSFSKKIIILLLIQIFLIIKCMATGPFVALILVFLLVLLLEKRKKNINLAYWFCLINIGFVFIMTIGNYILERLLFLVGETSTLTGRTDLWGIIINNLIEGNFLTGYGFGTAWGTGSEIELSIYHDYMLYLGNAPVGSHHLLLEIWLQVGIVGMVAFLMMFCHAANRSKFLKLKEYRTITNGLILLFILQSLVERTISSMGYNTLIVFIILTILLNYGEKNTYDKNLFRASWRTMQ
jgi:O-antigen ligase